MPSGRYHTIIIGGGQAGLAAAWFLLQQQRDFVILEAAERTGESWLNRYDSLTLFTSARYNKLPGMDFSGDKNHFPTKYETAAYLQAYASRFQFPLLYGHRAVSLLKEDDVFLVETNQGLFRSENVIVCTGPFQTPFIPAFSQAIDKSILQLHSSVYKNPQHLGDGDVLIVGGGNSGVQIAEEIAATGRQTWFSFGDKLKALPNNRLMQRLIFGSGITSASIHSIPGNWLRKRPEPIMGTNLHHLFGSANVHLPGRTVRASGTEIHCEKEVLDSVRNIIWATGFRPDFSWIKHPVFNNKGFPVEERGVTTIKGLYFLGLSWMYSRNSGLLGGVKQDAAYVTARLM